MGIFSKKTWLARLGTNLNRFTDTTTSNVMMLENTPTTVTQDGDSFNTENMNGLEDRIDTAVETVNTKAANAQSTADTGVANAATAQTRADNAYTLAGTKQDALGFTPENVANKGTANGYCGLDSGGKVALQNLPSTLLKYQSVWDASTNTPTLTNPDTSKIGYVYTVSVAGTQFGIDFKLGDWLIYNSSGIPEKSDNSDDVVSVNGRTGAVTGLAEDSAVIHNTGNETVGGNKEFSGGIEADKGVFATGFSQDSLPSDTEGISVYRNTSLGVNRIASFIKSALGVLTYTGLAIGAYVGGKFSAVFNADGTVNFNFRTTSPSIPRCTYQTTLDTATNSITITNRNQNGETGAINAKRFELNIDIPASAAPNGTHPVVYMQVNGLTAYTYRISVNDVYNNSILLGFLTQLNSTIQAMGNINQGKFKVNSNYEYNETTSHTAGIMSGNNTVDISAITAIKIWVDSSYLFPIGTKIQLIETEIL